MSSEHCLCCRARLDTATPYPQLCVACRATGTELAMRLSVAMASGVQSTRFRFCSVIAQALAVLHAP